MTDTPLETVANHLLAKGFDRTGPSVETISDPIVDTPMIMTLDRLKPYDLDPRVTRNPRYDEIKESIRHRGLDSPPSITRRPGEANFRIRNGGNTRLSIRRELWSETKDDKFFRFGCLFRPWPTRGEIVALTGHLAENELRSALSFIERVNRGFDITPSLLDGLENFVHIFCKDFPRAGQARSTWASVEQLCPYIRLQLFNRS